jgi:hypothetical protein
VVAAGDVAVARKRQLAAVNPRMKEVDGFFIIMAGIG